MIGLAQAPRLRLESLSRRFGARTIFEDVSLEISSGQTLVVAGPNGSGKSTLLRICCGVLRPSSGACQIFLGDVEQTRESWRHLVGYVAPDLVLYRELSAVENLRFFARLKGIELDTPRLRELLLRVGLLGRGHDPVRVYSSGMRRRLQYAFALSHSPPILILDEPSANLDADGASMVREVVEEQKRIGLIVIGTNEADEAKWGDVTIDLGSIGREQQ